MPAMPPNRLTPMPPLDDAPEIGLTPMPPDPDAPVASTRTLQDTGRGGPCYHIMPPNQPSCNTSAAYGVIDSFIAASSFHPGGVNVLLMDGSARFIKSSINLSIWNALGTRADGEVVSADAF